MPNCFQLIRKSDGKPELLTKIDELICAHLNRPVHPTQYVESWFDIIGYDCAMGRSFEQIREKYRKMIEEENYDKEFWERQIGITEFLETQFTPDAWYQVGR